MQQKRFKLWTALILSISMILQMGFGVLAAENVAEGKQELSVPANLGWANMGDAVSHTDGTTYSAWSDWTASWDCSDEFAQAFDYELYRDGRCIYSSRSVYNTQYSDSGNPVSNCVSFVDYINESGTYQFRVRTLGYYNSSDYSWEFGEWSELSPEKVYVKPETVLGSTVGYWDTENVGKFYFNGVDNAEYYSIDLYRMNELGYESSYLGTKYYPQNTENGKDSSTNLNTYDFAEWFERYGDGFYRVKVTAKSNDIDQVAHGPEGTFSDYYVRGDIIMPEKTDIPTGLHWSTEGQNKNLWCVEWDPVDGAEFYMIELYKDGNKFPSTYMSYPEDNCVRELYDEILEGGNYQVRIQSGYYNENDDSICSGWSELSEVRTYIKPERSLATTIAHWDESRTGWLSFPAVEGAYGYMLKIEQCDDAGNTLNYMYSSFSASGTPGTDNQTSEEWILKHFGAGKYRVTINVLSGNIDEVAHSGFGPYSSLFDTKDSAIGIVDAIDTAMENGASASEVLQTLEETYDKSKLSLAMQTDDDLLNQMKDLEAAYAQEKGISVGSAQVTEEASAYVKSEDISMVGGGLNVESGSVNLNVSVPSEEKKLDTERYGRSVQLNIQLVQGDTEIHDLSVPVTITMPIPENINVYRLVIFHFHADGTAEEVIFKNNWDGTITFTVSDFSTFAFAELSDETEEPGDPDVSSGDAGDATGGDTGDDRKDDHSSGSDNYSSRWGSDISVDWTAGAETIGKAKAGENVNIPVGISFSIPVEIQKQVAKKNVTLACQVSGTGVTLTLSGHDVKNPKENMNLHLSNQANIPEAAKQDIMKNALTNITLNIGEKKFFTQAMNLHIALGAKYAGKTAAMYSYDEITGKMRYEGKYVINDKGQAMFRLLRGDEYVIIVTDGNLSASDSAIITAGNYVVVSGDSLSKIASQNRISLKTLLEANPQIKNINRIFPGDVIFIPGK